MKKKLFIILAMVLLPFMYVPVAMANPTLPNDLILDNSGASTPATLTYTAGNWEYATGTGATNPAPAGKTETITSDTVITSKGDLTIDLGGQNVALMQLNVLQDPTSVPIPQDGDLIIKGGGTLNVSWTLTGDIYENTQSPGINSYYAAIDTDGRCTIDGVTVNATAPMNKVNDGSNDVNTYGINTDNGHGTSGADFTVVNSANVTANGYIGIGLDNGGIYIGLAKYSGPITNGVVPGATDCNVTGNGVANGIVNGVQGAGTYIYKGTLTGTTIGNNGGIKLTDNILEAYVGATVTGTSTGDGSTGTSIGIMSSFTGSQVEALGGTIKGTGSNIGILNFGGPIISDDGGTILGTATGNNTFKAIGISIGNDASSSLAYITSRNTDSVPGQSTVTGISKGTLPCPQISGILADAGSVNVGTSQDVNDNSTVTGQCEYKTSCKDDQGVEYLNAAFVNADLSTNVNVHNHGVLHGILTLNAAKNNALEINDTTPANPQIATVSNLTNFDWSMNGASASPYLTNTPTTFTAVKSYGMQNLVGTSLATNQNHSPTLYDQSKFIMEFPVNITATVVPDTNGGSGTNTGTTTGTTPGNTNLSGTLPKTGNTMYIFVGLAISLLGGILITKTFKKYKIIK